MRISTNVRLDSVLKMQESCRGKPYTTMKIILQLKRKICAGVIYLEMICMGVFHSLVVLSHDNLNRKSMVLVT